MNKLITASHNVIEGGMCLSGLSICLQSEWRNDEIVPSSDVLEVTVVGFDEAADWAVLQISKGNTQFNPCDVLEICPLNEIPAMKTESKYKIYQCPCEFFLNRTFTSVQAEATAWMTPCSLTVSQGEICFRQGFSKGSSGGCVVDSSGRVVAFHISSTSTSLTMAEAQKLKSPQSCEAEKLNSPESSEVVVVETETAKPIKQSKQETLSGARKRGRESKKVAEQMAEKAATELAEKAAEQMAEKVAEQMAEKLFIDSVSEAINSSAHSHVSISTCVIISFHKTLMACLDGTFDDAHQFAPITVATEKASAL
jgi:hypothetical protein